MLLSRTASAAKTSRLPKMTEAQFIDWCDEGTRAEWVDGEVILMSPVESRHARLVSFLITLINNYAEKRQPGEVFTEPFQIRFGGLKRRRSPDIIYLKEVNRDRVRNLELDGAADLIIEIISPSTRAIDYRDKLSEYEAAGVTEYWIIDPTAKVFNAYRLRKTKRYDLIKEQAGRVHSAALPGFYLKTEWLWQERLPMPLACLREILRRRKSK